MNEIVGVYCCLVGAVDSGVCRIVLQLVRSPRRPSLSNTTLGCHGKKERQERGAFETWRNDVPAAVGRRLRRGVFFVDGALLPRMLPGRRGVSGQEPSERVAWRTCRWS